MQPLLHGAGSTHFQPLPISSWCAASSSQAAPVFVALLSSGQARATNAPSRLLAVHCPDRTQRRVLG